MGQFFILRSRVQQEYNSLLVNALNRIFKAVCPWIISNGCLQKWSFRAFEIPLSRNRLWNEYPVLNQELQNHDPVGWHIPAEVMYGSTPPGSHLTCLTDKHGGKHVLACFWARHYVEWLIKQLLNAAFVSRVSSEELWRSRRVISALIFPNSSDETQSHPLTVKYTKQT